MNLVEKLRIIRRLLVTDMTMATIYRGEFLIYMLSVIVTPLIGLFVWRTALQSGATLPRDIGFFTTYFLLLAIVNWLTSSWLAEFIADGIRTGDILRWVIRPGSTHFSGIANNISEKLIKGIFLIPMVAIAMILFRSSLELPTSPRRWFLFGVAVICAAVLRYGLDVLIGSLGFWLDDVVAINRGQALLSAVLGGQLVPLALMPAWAEGALAAQPFRYIISFPLEIITGDLTEQELAVGFALQFAWTAVIVWAALTLWRKGLRGYAAFGS